MASVKITKSDLIWSYLARFFSLATSLVVLPFMLNKLTAEEVGLNYLMFSVSSLVTLLDFGFVYQFGRNFTYVYSGAQKLLKEGIEEPHGSNEINYKLLSTLLKTAKFVYAILSTICFILMITFGTVYVYHSTEGFTLVPHSLIIWIIFSISTYFNIYFCYYNSLLTGSGKIKENNIATILSKSIYLFIAFTLLYLGYGLFSVVIANLCAPFAQRLYSHRCFYTVDLKSKLIGDIKHSEIKELFLTIWYNSKKLGVHCLGNYAISNANTFLIGLFLPLPIVASFGLLKQLVATIQNIAQVPYTTYQPMLAYYKVNNEMKQLKVLTLKTMGVYWFVMLSGCTLLLILAPYILSLIGSNTKLPNNSIIIIYSVAILLEGNHNNCTTLITVFNKIPYFKANLITGFIIVLLMTLSLKFTSYGLIAIVFIHFICQLAYNNWKWPLYIYKELTNQEK